MLDTETANVDSPHMRRAGKDLLSLALIDARNHTLRWIAACEQALARDRPARAAARRAEPAAVGARPHRLVPGVLDRAQPAARARRRVRPDAGATGVDRAAGRPLVRPVQRAARQPLAARAARPAGHPAVPRGHARDDARSAGRPPTRPTTRCTSIAWRCSTRTCTARPSPTCRRRSASTPACCRRRDASPRASRCCFRRRCTRWVRSPGGFVFDNEKWAHDVAVPEFEIDAQAVSWAQYVEFVEDGGYDDARWWTPEGWAWVQRSGPALPAPRGADAPRRARAALRQARRACRWRSP